MKKNIIINGETTEIEVIQSNSQKAEFIFEGKTYKFEFLGGTKNDWVLQSSNKNYTLKVANSSKVSNKKFISLKGIDRDVEAPTRGRVKNKSDDQGHMLSPMPGKVVKVLKKEGDEVQKGEPILILEAMKMEHTIKASREGQIEGIFYKENDLVDGQVELVKIKAPKK